MKFYNLFVCFRIFVFMSLGISAIPHYYCIPADAKHFHILKNLIGSIHKEDFKDLGEIAIFDLGFNQVQRSELARMEKVKVYDVEMTHPDLLRPFQTHLNGRRVRGFFAWKPVIIKQALDKFPYILYIDAGSTILKSLDDFFEHIEEHGYFLLSGTKGAIGCQVNRITKPVVDRIVKKRPVAEQMLILSENSYQIDAGLQGLSRKMLDNYVMPMYQHSKELDLFEDDGTAKFGYGEGRHDQTLFTVYALCLKLHIYDEGWLNLSIRGKAIPVHIHWDKKTLNENTVIYRSRHDIKFQGGKTKFIKYNGRRI